MNFFLTNPQNSIWHTEKFYKGTNINNICGYVYIQNKVNFSLLKQAIYELVKTNDGIRLQVTEENNVCTQYVQVFNPFEIEHILLSSNDEIEKKASQLASIPLQLKNKPLFRFVTFELPTGTGGIILNLHHLISDSWSIGLISKEIIRIYSDLLEGTYQETMCPSYLSYIEQEKHYMNSNKFLDDQLYWKELFATIPETASVPSYKSCSSSVVSCKGSRKKCFFADEHIEQIKDFCENHKISIFNFFMAIYSLYIGRVSSLDDFVIGTPILNRTNFEQKQTLGMFVSTAPLKISINHSLSFAEFCKEISNNTLSLLRHQKYPYQSLLAELRKSDASIPNLYSIVLSYQITKAVEKNCTISHTTNWVSNGNCAEDIQIHLFDINDENTITVAYDYKIDKYDEQDIIDLHSRILTILQQVLQDNDVLLKNIEIVTPEEKQKILYEFNNTTVDYPRDKTIVDLFEEQVEKTPNHIAVVYENQKLTYKELNEKANQLAHYLIENNVKAKDAIGIMVHRSPEMIIGLLAILKIGAYYLPIDPEYPKDRIKYMLEDSKCSTILIHHKTMNLLEDIYNYIDISMSASFYYSKNTKNINMDILGTDLIYLIYTSGSTGKPKGVMLTHKNINNFIFAVKQKINFIKNKVMLSVTTICFDIFALEIWCSLSSGMKLVLASDDEQINPSSLRNICEKNSVNMIQTTPSRYFLILSDTDNSDFFNNFTDILVGGEPLPKSLLYKLKNISKANIFNMYGPTETTVWSTIKDLTNTEDINIGKPIANTSCYILDKNKKLLPPLIPGELYIGGEGVSNGYWERENLTHEKFIRSPFHKDEIIYNTGDLCYFNYAGEIIHLGRTDFQVKIRGYRIELEEIQNKLLEFPSISNCIITTKENKFIICYYVANEELSSHALSSFLLNSLPSYMIPSYYIRINSIPMTPNGKLNRALLPDIVNTDIKIEEAKTDTELKISSIVSKIVNFSPIDINTPFINLGLDSLGVIKAQTMLLKFGLTITTQDFYKYFTIKKLAEKIDSNIVESIEKDISFPSKFRHSIDEISSNISSIKIEEDSFNNVFLTGANGFIGIHILHELLSTTKNIIYCLVRGENKEHSFERLRKAYFFYFNEDIIKHMNDRIYIVCSDIVSENYGLSSDEINNFSTIIHTVAIVKHYGNFNDFEKVNIKGTESIAKFAYKHCKRLIHISSISVSGNYLVKQDNKNTDFSENSIFIGQHYTDNVYVRSKLEAEKIVLSYMNTGLVAQIHRIGIIAGRYSDGIFQEKIEENAFYGRIKSMISLGAISIDMLNQEIEFTPIDFCAKAIVLLGKHSACNNKIYHLYNSNLIKISTLIEIFKKYGIQIKILSKKDFNDYIYKLSVEQESASLNSIINDISYDSNHLLNINYDYTVHIKSEYSQRYLSILNFNWPDNNSNYIEKLLDYMINVGFLVL